MTTTTGNGVREGARPATAARPKQSRLRHTPGGVGLGKNAGHEARRLAAAIFEVLAGVRTPSQAAEALGMSLPRYFQIETRAMHALVESCEPRPRGRQRSADHELAALKRQHERLQRELSRQQTLVRLTQRTMGLAPPKAPVRKGEPGVSTPGGKCKKRQRRPVVRALRAAEALQRRSQETKTQEARSQEVRSQEAASAAGTPENHEQG
jgi:hypothetical protein